MQPLSFILLMFCIALGVEYFFGCVFIFCSFSICDFIAKFRTFLFNTRRNKNEKTATDIAVIVEWWEYEDPPM